jgi:hypothetical protein
MPAWESEQWENWVENGPSAFGRSDGLSGHPFTRFIAPGRDEKPRQMRQSVTGQPSCPCGHFQSRLCGEPALPRRTLL